MNRHIYFYRLMLVYIQTCTPYIFLEKLNMIIYLMLIMTSCIENYTGKIVEFALENYLNGLLVSLSVSLVAILLTNLHSQLIIFALL